MSLRAYWKAETLLCWQRSINQSYGHDCFSSSHVWMWELDHKKGWVLKNWCFWTVKLEKTLWESLGLQGDQPINPKGTQSWIFIGGADAEAEAPILWISDVKTWPLKETLMLGKIEGRRRRGWQDEMVAWHHQLNGHEFKQAPGDGEGQGSLVCCRPWGWKESDTTEQLNNKISLTGLQSGSLVKNLPASTENTGDEGSFPGLVRSPGQGNGHSLKYSYLGNSMGNGAWQATIHGVAKSQIWLSN